MMNLPTMITPIDWVTDNFENVSDKFNMICFIRTPAVKNVLGVCHVATLLICQLDSSGIQCVVEHTPKEEIVQ